jgi:hypothetical protein
MRGGGAGWLGCRAEGWLPRFWEISSGFEVERTGVGRPRERKVLTSN